MSLSNRNVADLKELIEEYASDVASKYWMDDQGRGRDVDVANENYEKSKARLYTFIESLKRNK